jgi:hypothetical protein
MSIDQPTHVSTTARRFGTPRQAIARAALYLGALAVLATGIAHAQQFYAGDYSSVPTIGTLFYLNFLAAVVIAAGLVVPLGGRIAGRYADAIRAAFAVAGIGLGALSLVALFVSESSGLFGFQENGYRTPIALAIVFEVAAVVCLVTFLIANGAGLARIRSGSR